MQYTKIIVPETSYNKAADSRLLIPFVKFGLIGFYNNNGEIVVEPQYTQYEGECYNDSDVVKVAKLITYGFHKGGDRVATYHRHLWGLIDSKGKEILPLEYYDLIPAIGNKDLFTAKKQGAYSLINIQGEEIVPYGEYQYIDGLDHGYARIRTTNNLWGLIDEKGKTVLSPIHNTIWNFYGKNRLSTKIVDGNKEYLFFFYKKYEIISEACKKIIQEIEKHDGLKCYELTVNSFCDYNGLHTIAFLEILNNKGYKLDSIKLVRLFSEIPEDLQTTLSFCRSYFPHIRFESYNLDICDINDEINCNSLLTINLFPNTLKKGQEVWVAISDRIVNSHLLYSHSIFFEDVNRTRGNDTIDCYFYWKELTKYRFVQNAPVYSSCNNHSVGGTDEIAYCIFSNISLLNMSISHIYKIPLPELCPGVFDNDLLDEAQINIGFTPKMNVEQLVLYYKKKLDVYSLNQNVEYQITGNRYCKNLILLMYQNNYPLGDIFREYSKVKKPSEELVYAFTVIFNNELNLGKDRFRILKPKIRNYLPIRD